VSDHTPVQVRGNGFTRTVSLADAIACLSGHYCGDVPAHEALLRFGKASTPSAVYSVESCPAFNADELRERNRQEART
jgi:hypothetical protein